MQASKEDDAQPMIADRLRSFNPRLGAADVCVVGCGPAGLALAAELAGNGVHVALVGKHSEDICLISHSIVTVLEPEASMQCSVYMSESQCHGLTQTRVKKITIVLCEMLGKGN